METSVKIAYAIFVTILALACVGGIGLLWYYYHATREPEGFSE